MEINSYVLKIVRLKLMISDNLFWILDFTVKEKG